MNPVSTERKTVSSRPTAEGHSSRRWLDRVSAGLLAALIVCRLLTPTDAAPSGETIWIAQLSFLALIVWAVAVYRSGRLRLSIDWIDFAVLLLCTGHVTGALLVVATSGDKRAALNMLWEWCGVATTFFLMRRHLADPAVRRSLLLVVAAVAVSLAGLGLWQHYAGYAQIRRDYETMKSEWESLETSGRPADPRDAIEWNRAVQRLRADFVRMEIPSDDTARMLWEQRLYSSEPMALFSLTNTLAGFLTCAAVVWLGRVVNALRSVPRWQVAFGASLTLLVLYCLLLTKSRTAYVGLLLGLAAWGVASRMWRPQGLGRQGGLLQDATGFGRQADTGEETVLPGSAPPHLQQAIKRGLAGKSLAVGLIFAIGLIIAAGATGGLDRLVVSESTKSLRYRFEYWHGTLQMLLASPRNWIVGVGPGNFRQNYLPFKLPQSSEEIADPHNLVLDAWANGGLLALVGLAGVCAAGLRPFWRRVPQEDGQAPRKRVEGDIPTSRDRQVATAVPLAQPAIFAEPLKMGDPSWRDGVLGGAVVGFLALLVPGDVDEATIVLLFVAWLSIVSICHSLYRRNLPPFVCAAAFVALAVHLLGAGGIGMPAISLTLLLMVVLAEAVDPAAGWRIESTTRWPMAAIGLAGLGLYFGCWFTGLTPVASGRALLAAGRYELLESRRPDKAEKEFRRAADADPWSSKPYDDLAQLAFQSWLASGSATDELFQRGIDWQRESIARNPHHAGGYRMLGQMYLAKFERQKDAAAAVHAADGFSQAVVYNPNHALLQSELAEALSKAGRFDEARTAAQRATQLEAINRAAGHRDKWLPAVRRKLMNELGGAH